MLRLIGDIHGIHTQYHALLQGWDGPSIQIGDYGLGFSGREEVDEYILGWQSRHPQHRFIRGNHDNPATCRAAPNYIADGTIEGDIMFIGGAWSIDNPNAPPGWYRRTPMYDWWPDEECSDEQFEAMLDAYTSAKPRILITHDCPASISYEMFWKSGKLRGPTYRNRTAHWLDKFYEAHQPQFHFFGHWHFTTQLQTETTLFQCIGELDYLDLEI